MGNRFIVKAYIPADVDPEDETYFEDEDDANAEWQQLVEMQPENIYLVVQVDENGEEIEEI